MEIIVFGKNVRPTQALKEFTEEKILSALRSMRHTVDRVRVILSREKEVRLARVQCNIGKRSLALQEEDGNMYGAISVLASRLNKKVAKEEKKKRTGIRKYSTRSVSTTHR